MSEFWSAVFVWSGFEGVGWFVFGFDVDLVKYDRGSVLVSGSFIGISKIGMW